MAHQPASSTTLLIRPAIPVDVAVIWGFLSELEEQPLDFIKFRLIFDRNLTDPMVHYFVAVLAGAPIGFVSCHVQYLLHHVGKVGEIQELFVRPGFRNQNVGHQLIQAVEALALREEFVHVEVTTNQKRVDTLRFYERELFHCTHYKLVKPIRA